MERALLERFDERIARRGYENRSEALRDLVRAALVRDEWDRGGIAVASITLLYDVSVRETLDRVHQVLRDEPALVITSNHVHVNPQQALMVVIAKGEAALLRALAERLLGQRGVLTGDIVVAAAGDL